MSSGRLRCLLVEDDLASLRALRTAVLDHPEVDVVGTANSSARAAEALRRLAPDLVFLDIRLPDGDGFRVVEAVGPENMPAVVFVSGYDQYAARAFRVAAVDYLVKPIDGSRVGEALKRSREMLRLRRSGAISEELAELARTMHVRAGPKRLAVRDGGLVRLVDYDEILWLDAVGSSTRVNTKAGGTLSHRQLLGEVESKLDQTVFLRVHRSSIVNLQFLEEVRINEWGDYTLVLEGGQRISVGRTYRARLERAL